MKKLIFVYGTLRQNQGNHGFLQTARFLGKAKTQNKYVMHCRGYIPFVSEGQAISHIVGEVYEVDDSTLSSIDHLEGCYPKRDASGEFEQNSWYIRKQVMVTLQNAQTDCLVWLYFNEQETQHPIICTGDFLDREALLQRDDRVWYFAYGSNMDASRMLDRKAYFTQRVFGSVGGQRLVFNKIARDFPGYGYANIVPESGFNVIGVLYEVNKDIIETIEITPNPEDSTEYNIFYKFHDIGGDLGGLKTYMYVNTKVAKRFASNGNTEIIFTSKSVPFEQHSRLQEQKYKLLEYPLYIQKFIYDETACQNTANSTIQVLHMFKLKPDQDTELTEIGRAHV